MKFRDLSPYCGESLKGVPTEVEARLSMKLPFDGSLILLAGDSAMSYLSVSLSVIVPSVLPDYVAN